MNEELREKVRAILQELCGTKYDFDDEIGRLLALCSAPRWIPVSEQLPKDNELVWAWDGYDDFPRLVTYAGAPYKRDFAEFVRVWMHCSPPPLPAAPRGESGPGKEG